MSNHQVLVGQGEVTCALQGRYANRHGLVAGATGTGKTITLQILAEGFADLGVPVFLADIKGDVAGMSQPGDAGNAKLAERAAKTGMSDFRVQPYPVVFWDVFGEQGHPVRATISDLGPLLLTRMLDLNDTQEGVLNLLFKYADDNGLLLLDLKDLRSLLSFASDNLALIGSDYGTISKQSIGVIQRALLTLEQQGAERFFGEPALQLEDFMQTTLDGRGIINVLAADKLYQQPRLYATFLLWLLSELFEQLPERGDADLPKLVFFFDEAHLLFKDAPKALLDKVEQVVRLIRSKGVGVYFITQNPLDVPETILGQLGNRVQHGLRAFTPRDQKAVRAAAETFRAKPGLDVTTAILELGVGEALVSTLGEGGVPTPVERAKVRPPRSRMGAITPEERQTVMSRSPFRGRYDQVLDRESAYEKLQVKAEQRAAEAEAVQTQKAAEKVAAQEAKAAARRPAREPDSIWETAAKSAARAASSEVGRKIGRELLRGLLGSLSGKR
ncbi:helicase HerA-like domain-containing protein [Amnimonas aquatica]|uniref:ATP-binding protein n=1 Tax=Amnimonas aquatica TaxID=2094561 RepID=A0A2P6ARZ4_9GAMM|nr:helicase HerA-like domain-containing protein [Amnimonas aquatica]PQA40072.1 ATP-binding protein [Amnimonas aquatica]